MNKNPEMLRSVEDLKYIASEYEDYEEAYTLLPDDDHPIKYIVLGSTKPCPHYKNKRPPTKSHDIFEYVVSGKGYIFINNALQTLKAGCMYIVGKDDARNFYSDPDDPMYKLWIGFSSEYIDMMMLGYGIGSGVYRVDVEKYFRAICSVSGEKTSEEEKMFKIADNLHKIILSIAQKKDTDSPSVEKRIECELSAAVYRRATLDEIAAKLFISRASLIRIFKNYKGVTPYQFLLEKKLAVAKVLLITTHLSIKSISEKLCFADEHYFSHIFKEKVGVSPFKYRMSKREE